jgi:hypothetical protein
MPTLTLHLLPDQYAVARSNGSITQTPAWDANSKLLALIQTPGETTLVCREEDLPTGYTAEVGWRALVVEGPLAFELTGILASLAEPLAQAGVSIYAISTYSTDIILIKENMLSQATAALNAAGHNIL